MIKTEKTPEREIETVLSHSSDREKTFGCVRFLKKHLRPPGLCRFRDQGCTKLNCKFAHRLPDHLSLPIYCKAHLRGLCEDELGERQDCLSLHHFSYQYLNQIYLQKRQEMLNSCNTCLKQVGVKKVNDLDADSISNTEDNSVLAEIIGLPKKISLVPYGSQYTWKKTTMKNLGQI